MNFLLTSKSEDADMKLINFSLSDFIRTDERLNDIAGSAYYVVPEVLHRCHLSLASSRLARRLAARRRLPPSHHLAQSLLSRRFPPLCMVAVVSSIALISALSYSPLK
ncbi:hypothetical protein HN873_009391, partial [Arachis hypogaea]